MVGEWKKDRVHSEIHRLYVDVECPEDCERNTVGDFGFLYCENCHHHSVVCARYHGVLHKYGYRYWDKEDLPEELLETLMKEKSTGI